MTNFKVLVVDDEAEFASTLAERLNMRNFKTEMAYSGGQALAMVKPFSPDVVLLDLKMPDMNGLDVLDRIRAIDPTVEVIMLTGHGAATNGYDGSKIRGAFDYIMKPVEITELVEKIRHAGNRCQQSRKIVG
ncbi:MAG: hypothetical protein A2511_00780 [Deltaproteobacteria bacterium RIFOXYD12_FULL_50_9]|nr:MAG: hypothetical protein A2511_00780 [Deltaproteobacteria bacterium RIFOXYD12_FULL_50_9]